MTKRCHIGMTEVEEIIYEVSVGEMRRIILVQ